MRFPSTAAIPLDGGGWFRFIGDTETSKLPMRPFWLESMVFEYWDGKEKAETAALCRKRGVDVLILIHISKNARGDLLRELLQKQKQKRKEVPSWSG